jgi:sarcosine oxidase subunit alpha
MKPLIDQPFRLPKGGQVDRRQVLDFTFNGRHLQGYAGDSLAAALLANGIHHVARSFKYHRPRGIYSAGEEEPNALLEIGEGNRRTPNCRATLVPLRDGLAARSQLGWPSLRLDLGRALDFTHRLWPAGFYNKTFKWPSWHFWERTIRTMAGLGRAPDEVDPDLYEKVNAFCDLLVVGAGPAGLMAALVAGRAGLQVIVADQDERFGGSLNWDSTLLDGKPALHWVDEAVTELRTMPNVLQLPRTTVTGNYDHQVTTLLQRGEGPSHGATWRECLWTVRPRAILLATGAIEQSLVFPGNDRPGIMLASAARQYANRYAVKAGNRVVVCTNNDSAWQAAADLHSHGIEVAALLDQRETVPEALRAQAEELRIPLHTGAVISTTRGGTRIRRVDFSSGGKVQHLNCDTLAISGGWAPRLHLLCHARGRLRFDMQRQAFVPDRLPPGFKVIGSACGEQSLPEVFAQAESVGRVLCELLAQCSPPNPASATARPSGVKPNHVHQPVTSRTLPIDPDVAPARLDNPRGRQWLDLAHDVTLDDAGLAVREGFVSVEHFKRFTTTGMSLDQGKTGNINAFLALSALTGKPIAEIGTTTFRPPYMPITLGALALGRSGEDYAPIRNLAAENTHRSLGAVFEDYGWLRADYYPQAGEDRQQAINREVLAVRQGVGVFDNSPIGKIEVRGPDAAEFLHRIYLNRVHGLGIGQCRYGLMLNEAGAIIDDGIILRLAEEHFLLNTTSAGATRILGWLEDWSQTEWPGLQLLIDDVSQQWANFTVAGPRAREVLQALESGLDLSAANLRHMQCLQGEVEGLPCRVNRISFSGELSYELNVPSSHANAFLKRLLLAGESFGITPYGIEALMTLRLEKGYLHVGSDTDGETIPDDVGWGRLALNKAEDFIGKRSLSRPVCLDAQRRQLVGLQCVDAQQVMHAGGHLLPPGGTRIPAPSQGWITSASFSPTLQRHIGLGRLRNGRAMLGRTLQVYDSGKQYAVEVVAPCFLDPENQRLRS